MQPVPAVRRSARRRHNGNGLAPVANAWRSTRFIDPPSLVASGLHLDLEERAGPTRAATCTVDRAGLFGCSGVPKNLAYAAFMPAKSSLLSIAGSAAM